MKKTAVEWLEDKLTYANGYGKRYNRYHETRDLSEYFDEAKKMEKEQLIEAYEKALENSGCSIDNFGEEYYNENFNA